MAEVALLASSAGSGLAMAIGGVAAVVVLSVVFYLIGRGEDRERAASAAAPDVESGGERPEAPSAPAAAAARSRAPRATRRRPRR